MASPEQKAALPDDRNGIVTVMLTAWRNAEGYNDVGRMHEAVNALYAHLTKPAPAATYTVRCISHLDTEFADCGLPLEDVAARVADHLRKGYREIRVTGPHKQEVPA